MRKAVSKFYSAIILTGTFLLLLFFNTDVKSQTSSSGCINAGFENGDFTNWTGFTGSFSGGNLYLPNMGIVNGRQTIMSVPGEDPNTINPLTGHGISYLAPNGGIYTCRLGNSITGTSYAERLTYSMNVNSQNDLFYYWFAVVLQDPGHPPGLQPSFKIELTDASGNDIGGSCGYYYVYARSGIPDFYISTATSGGPAPADVCCKDWSVAGVDLSAYIGQNVTLQFTTTHCGEFKHYGYAYIAAGCAPMAINLSYCAGTTTATATAPTGFSYSWTGPGISAPVTTQTLNIPDVVAGAVYSCVCTSVTGCSVTLTTTILSTSVNTDFSENIQCRKVTFTDNTTVTGPGSISSWSWDFGDGITANIENPVHTYVNPGTYNAKLSVSVNGCTGIYSKTITISPMPVTISSNQPVCIGNDLVLSAGGGSSYSWTGPNGFTSSQQNPKITRPMQNASGIYYVSISNSQCSAIDSIDVNISQNMFVRNSPDTSICKLTPFQLVAKISGGLAPMSVYWNGHLSKDTIDISIGHDTTFSVFAIDAKGCLSDTSTLRVDIYPNVKLKLVADNDTICKNSFATLNAVISSGNGGPFTTCYANGTPVSFPLTVYPDSSQNYIFYAKDACGSVDFDTLRIVTITEPSMSFSSDKSRGCQSLPVQFNEPGPVSNRSYEWDFGDGYTSQESNPAHIFATAGLFDISLDVVSKYGCSYHYVHFKMIDVYPKPVADFLISPEIASIENPIILFSDKSTGSVMDFWSMGDGDSSNTSNFQYSYSSPGTYNARLIVESKDGCFDTISREIIILDRYTFYAPTAFSPNNDGINDIFNVYGNGIDPGNFHLLIYDRWGFRIFETNDISQGWDGKDRGKVIHDTYVWMATFKYNDGVEMTKSGSVSVLK